MLLSSAVLVSVLRLSMKNRRWKRAMVKLNLDLWVLSQQKRSHVAYIPPPPLLPESRQKEEVSLLHYFWCEKISKQNTALGNMDECHLIMYRGFVRTWCIKVGQKLKNTFTNYWRRLCMHYYVISTTIQLIQRNMTHTKFLLFIYNYILIFIAIFTPHCSFLHIVCHCMFLRTAVEEASFHLSIFYYCVLLQILLFILLTLFLLMNLNTMVISLWKPTGTVNWPDFDKLFFVQLLLSYTSSSVLSVCWTV